MSFRRNPNFMPALKAEARKRLQVGAEVVRDTAVSIIEEPKSGEHWPGLPRRSSRPGEPPASQSGELAESIQTYPAVEDESSITIAVGSDLVKARLLEGGTSTKAPRPYLFPALMVGKDGVLKAMGGGNG